MSGPLEGGCLCGAVRYAVNPPLGPMGHCHCRTCRKAHGAAFATTARAPRAAFRWTAGEAVVAHFESSPGKKRFFCPRCGSPLVAAWDDQASVIVRVGSLDDDPGSRPLAHVWTAEKAPWYEIGDDLPSFAEGAPGAPGARARGPADGAERPAR